MSNKLLKFLIINKKTVISIILIMLFGIIFSYMKFTKDVKSNMRPSLTVTSAIATLESWPIVIETSGPVVAFKEAIISSEISGQRLVELLVDVGDVVKKGQVLARFNKDQLSLEYAQLQAQWLLAQGNARRARSLKGTGAMSNQDIETYINQAEIVKAQLDYKNLFLKYTEVIAPGDGVISSKVAIMGDVMNVGAELFRMIIDNKLEWRGEINPNQISLLNPLQLVELKLPDGSFAKGEVRQISPSFNVNSRMGTVYVDIDKDSKAMAGMYLSGVINVSSKNTIIVPALSVVIRDGYSYVFKLVNNEDVTRAVMQKVITGYRKNNLIEIIEGVSVGEKIALAGAGFLSDQDIVLEVAQ